MVGSQSGRPGPNVAFVLKSGRLVIYPVYKGTYRFECGSCGAWEGDPQDERTSESE